MNSIKYIKGKYYKPCAFKYCEEEAIGRIDKKFCSDACKNAFNNAKSSRVNKLAYGLDLKIKKANRILLKLFVPDENGCFCIMVDRLIQKAFPFDLPTRKYSDDRFRGDWECFGAYAFKRESSNKFIFIKTKN
jgi:hypothetical protein